MPSDNKPSPTRELPSAGPGTPTPPSKAVFNEIVHQLPTINKFTELVYEHVSPEDGLLICRSLVECDVAESRCIRTSYNALTRTLWVRAMTTELHDAHQPWVFHADRRWSGANLINDEESYILNTGVGTRFEGFTGPYSNSSKEPDMFIRSSINELPQIVIESGWSESWPRLEADKNLWLCGTTTGVMVILLKWSKVVDNKVKGVAEVWTRGASGLVARTIAIFPKPPNAGTAADRIVLTKGQVFGQRLLPGQNADDELPLNLWILRDYASIRMKRMGLVPV